MNLPIFLTEEAEQERLHAILWYEEQRAGLGDVFRTRLHECFDKISEHPELYPRTSEDLRCLSVPRYPYQILYSVKTDRIIIWSVFHSSGNPEIWQKRIFETP